MHRTRIVYLLLLLALTACTAVHPASPPPPDGTKSAPRPPGQPAATWTLVPTWTPTVVQPTITPTPIPAIRVAADAQAPAELRDAVQSMVQAHPVEFAWTELETADVVAGFNPALPLGYWVYAAVAPFPSVPDSLAAADLRSAWSGAAAGPFASRPLLLSPETAAVLQAQWETPPLGAQQVPQDELPETAWAARPAWSIVPFDALEPRWKVLRLDGLSPLDKPLDLAAYPLAFPVGLRGRADAVEKVWVALGGPAASVTNRDESQMTVLAMTGVTALVRATAYQMEIYGMTYPGEEVAAVLSAADIAHISNEVSFAEDCPYPNPSRQDGNLRFCSDDRYIELLEYVGADVIELTGNHNNDWGTIPFSRTLAMYQQREWGTFGGGSDAVAAGQPLTITHNGNTIGFIGCNPVGPTFAWATDETPGAARCSIQSLAATVGELAAQVDVVVVGIQYFEHYTYTATAQQRIDFLALASAGADIVNGSQGHHAQGFALPAEGGFVHYGLGNLFFDQMDRLGTRQTFVDRHVIYRGRHIATDLWTGLIENWARPRPMTAAERANLLQTVFAASGW